MNNVLLNTIGIIGAILVTYSNIPQILLFFRQKHAEGISISSTWIATTGIVFRAYFMMKTVNYNIIVIAPYFFAIVCCVITLYYCHFTKKAG